MCGIAGLLRLSGARADTEPLAPLLRRMAAAIAHRGPDGEDIWVSPSNDLGLAHRRLAIVDLSAAAAQPMRLDEAGLAVSYNGEIYNHLALRGELERQGACFRTDHADTEVLLHGYRAWGLDGLLQRLDGMYAFALWDGERRELHLARDRAGVKPLYFRQDGEGVTFASEIKAILAASPARPEMDAGAFRLYLSFMAAPAPLTLFKDIYKLPAGHALTIMPNGERRIRRHWTLRPDHTGEAATEPAIQLRSLLEAAVTKRLMGDVPVGLLLSGGVDSSAIAAIASRVAGVQLDSFTVGFDTPTALDETEHARATAARLGTRHHEIRIGAADLPGLLESAAFHQDEPLADWVCLPLLAVSGLIQSRGIKMVLAGEGADEVFCGYPGYLAYLRFHERYEQTIRALPSGIASLPGIAADLLGTFWPRAAALQQPLAQAGRGEPVFLGGAVGFTPADITALGGIPGEALLPPEWQDARYKDAASLIRGFEADIGRHAAPLDRVSYIEFQQRLPELLLMRLDKMAMARGIEVREPFLDRDLVDFTFRLAPEQRIAGNRPKALLKSALRGLVPDTLLDRPKVGFGAPVADWLRAPAGAKLFDALLDGALLKQTQISRPQVEAMIARHRTGQDCAVQLWTLINADAWHRRWISA